MHRAASNNEARPLRRRNRISNLTSVTKAPALSRVHALHHAYLEPCLTLR